jgi:tripartite-type tricarboxylate transporter receptor subunit TctC
MNGLIIRSAAIIAGAVLLGTSAFAQGWPAKPIKIIAPFGSGGSADITGRVFAAYLESQVKQPVVIENRPGASGIIGTELVKNAPPDGYTIQVVSNSTHAANASLFKKLPYDPIRDFEHVGLFGTFGSVAVVPPDSPIKSLADLTAFAKAGKAFYGHFNSASQVGGALFALRSGAPLEGVPYKALGNALADLYGKQISVIFLDYVASTSHIASGKLIPLGVTARDRHKIWPNVPAIGETYPGFDQIAYLGLAAPAGVPADILNTLHRHVIGAMTDPAIRSRLEGLGIVISTPSRDEYNRFVREQLDRWAGYVRDAKIQPE